MSSTWSAALWQQSLFDPKTGAFAVNIRDIGGDDSELRESLKKLGWVKEFPALVDENGVVLVGHHRLKVAEEERSSQSSRNSRAAETRHRIERRIQTDDERGPQAHRRASSTVSASGPWNGSPRRSM